MNNDMYTKTISLASYIMNLTDENLNQIIDDALGYKRDDPNERDNPPNYAQDLNAVQEAIITLSATKGTTFLVSVDSNLNYFIGHHDHMETDKIFASARRRAEALVMSLEKTK